MTQRDYSLLQKTFKVNLALIFTIISCTATFVWKGSKYANQITNTQATHATAIAEIKPLKDTMIAHNTRLTIIETKMER